jgi:hypothetical protein
MSLTYLATAPTMGALAGDRRGAVSETGGSALRVYLPSWGIASSDTDRTQTVSSLRVSRGSFLHLVVRIASYHRPVSPILVHPPGLTTTHTRVLMTSNFIASPQ